MSKLSWLDAVLAPFAIVARYGLRIAALIDHHFPMSRRILDGSGVRAIRHHYYTPIVGEADLHRPLDMERPLPGVDLNEAGQLTLVGEFAYRDELLALPAEKAGERFHYDNETFGLGDAEFLYNMIRHFRPRQLVEVGAGSSTRMAAEAIGANRKEDPGYSCRHVCIEPFEQPWLERFGVEVIRERVELVDRSLFSNLQAGDILFIDSSHVIRPQGDVVTEYLEILPTLQQGVVVHVHDVFTPRDYPSQWVIEERRLWSEQYLLEAFLSFNRSFEVIAAVNWLSHNHGDKLLDAAPMLHAALDDHEPGSFWIQRR